LANEVRTVDRSSTAERVAELLRRRVIVGDLPPGARLSEEQLVEVLHVSRNTLREAFRLLTHEGLLVHRLHEPYVSRNRALLDLLVAGETDRAVKELEVYLHDSEAQLVGAYHERSGRNL
jgi:DNA-binding transcriptional regulator YhcF (GntR family)